MSRVRRSVRLTIRGSVPNKKTEERIILKYVGFFFFTCILCANIRIVYINTEHLRVSVLLHLRVRKSTAHPKPSARSIMYEGSKEPSGAQRGPLRHPQPRAVPPGTRGAAGRSLGQRGAPSRERLPAPDRRGPGRQRRGDSGPFRCQRGNRARPRRLPLESYPSWSGPAATCPRPSGGRQKRGKRRSYVPLGRSQEPPSGRAAGSRLPPGRSRHGGAEARGCGRRSAALLGGRALSSRSPVPGPQPGARSGSAPGLRPSAEQRRARPVRPGVREARPPRAPGAAALRGLRGPAGARALFDVEETDHRGAAILRAPMEFKCQQV